MAGVQQSREVLQPFERVLEVLFTWLAMLLIGTFFLAHWLANTGFFTSEFGPTEMLALFGPMVLSLLAPIVRSATGLRNPGRLVEALANAALAVGSFWLLLVFPFDFSHFADVLPIVVQWMFWWVSNGIARLMLILQVVFGALTAFGKLVKFIFSLGD